MKKKYLSILIVLLIMFINILFVNTVKAANFAQYSEEENYNCKYASGKVKIGLFFTFPRAYSNIADSMGNIENYLTPIYGTKITLKDNNNVCPKYILFSGMSMQFAVADDDSLNVIKSASEELAKRRGKKVYVYPLVSQNLEQERPKDPYNNSNSNNSNKDDDEAKFGTSCIYFKDESTCKKGTTTPDDPQATRYSCVWNTPSQNKTGGYCNVDNLMYVACGDTYDIPYQVPELTSFLINLLKIVTPIILIVVSVITLLKALSASKEDEIKKAQSSLIKKVMAAVMVFFVITIVQFVISLVADGDKEVESASSCLDCFINNDCGNNAYYKASVSGEYVCKRVSDRTTFTCNK